MLDSRPLETPGMSLPDIHETVGTSHQTIWRRLLAFAGPAYLVSVGYMDPGNWATDLEGGARFGYKLLWVVVVSNLMAILLQTLSARLGIVTRRDLAQACRSEYPKAISQMLWILCEIAIVACDLAEVLGAAIGLNLLFKIPVLWGVLITALDTLLVLWFTRLGIRVIEAFVLSLIAIIAGCFAIEIFWAKPGAMAIVNGLIPRIDGSSLYIAVGILGATVMPHNLYLHSALVQTRRIGRSEAEKKKGVLVQLHRFHDCAERRAAGKCHDPDSRRGRVLQARHRGHADSAGTSIPDAATRHDRRQYAVWRGLDLLGTILDVDRHHGRPDRDGRLSPVPHSTMACGAWSPAHWLSCPRPSPSSISVTAAVSDCSS